MTTTTNQRIRFMDNNLAELSGGQVTFSSELAAFPATNAYANKFRSKVWKPSGYFNVDATNNKLYINDGADKTATITVDEYTTPALLATEMQTQLNSVSSGWTVNYNSVAGEYRFSFAHGSAHTLKLSNQTNAIWDLIGFTKTTDCVISTEQFACEQRNHEKEWIQFDMGYNAPIEFIGLISPLDEVFPISDQATVTLMANNLDSWTSPPLSITLEVTVGGILRFMDDIADTGYRYWRLEIEDKYNTLGPEGLSFGYLYLGDYTTLADRNITNGFNKTIMDPSIIQRSEAGAKYFDTKTKYAKFSSASIEHLSQSQRDELEQLFHDFGVHTPLFVSIDPRGCISSELYDMTKYCVFSAAPRFRHIRADMFHMSLDLEEVL